MKILNYNAYSGKNVYFQSCGRTYKAAETMSREIFDMEDIYTKTGLFREHIAWADFIDYVIPHFKNKSKVNIYSLGSSDGSEGYSYAIILAHRGVLDKYSIIGCDIDSEVINVAQSGIINLDNDDFTAMFKALEITNISKEIKNKFFKKIGEPIKINNDKFNSNIFHDPIYNPLYAYAPREEIRKSVRFYESDILSETNRIHDEGNTIINTCHILGYCNKDYVAKVLNNIGKNLKSGSLYVYDKTNNNPAFRKKLEDLGFFFPLKNMPVAEKI